MIAVNIAQPKAIDRRLEERKAEIDKRLERGRRNQIKEMEEARLAGVNSGDIILMRFLLRARLRITHFLVIP
jgi:hypothetical protein